MNPHSRLFLGLALCVLPGIALTQDEAPSPEAVAQEATNAGDALRSFLQAETWDAASQWILDREKLAERGTTHHESYPWAAMPADNIRHVGGVRVRGLTETYFIHDFIIALPVQDTEKELFEMGADTGEIVGSDPATPMMDIPATMVQTTDGYRLDWELFAQFRRFTFERFILTKQEGEATFRVALSRGAVLKKDENLPLGEGGEVLRLRARWRPGSEDSGDFFLAAESELGKRVAESVDWVNPRPFRVRIRWNTDGDRDVVQLLDLNVIDFNSSSVMPPEGD